MAPAKTINSLKSRGKTYASSRKRANVRDALQRAKHTRKTEPGFRVFRDLALGLTLFAIAFALISAEPYVEPPRADIQRLLEPKISGGSVADASTAPQTAIADQNRKDQTISKFDPVRSRSAVAIRMLDEFAIAAPAHARTKRPLDSTQSNWVHRAFAFGLLALMFASITAVLLNYSRHLRRVIASPRRK